MNNDIKGIKVNKNFNYTIKNIIKTQDQSQLSNIINNKVKNLIKKDLLNRWNI